MEKICYDVEVNNGKLLKRCVSLLEPAQVSLNPASEAQAHLRDLAVTNPSQFRDLLFDIRVYSRGDDDNIVRFNNSNHFRASELNQLIHEIDTQSPDLKLLSALRKNFSI